MSRIDLQRHFVELALDADPALVHRPERGELVADGEEPVARRGARLAEERQALDAVVDLSSAHALAVDEERHRGHQRSSVDRWVGQERSAAPGGRPVACSTSQSLASVRRAPPAAGPHRRCTGGRRARCRSARRPGGCRRHVVGPAPAPDGRTRSPPGYPGRGRGGGHPGRGLAASVCSSSEPSPVITSRAPGRWSAKPTRSRTSSMPGSQLSVEHGHRRVAHAARGAGSRPVPQRRPGRPTAASTTSAHRVSAASSIATSAGLAPFWGP